MIDWRTKKIQPPPPHRERITAEYPVVMACHLGANTSARLAAEWGIDMSAAANFLCRAYKAGFLNRAMEWGKRSNGRPCMIYYYAPAEAVLDLLAG